jgi:DNA polymerase-4
VILASARLLLRASLPLLEERGLTLVGVAVANLEDARVAQLALPLGGRDDDALDAVVDRVRDRFGSTAIGRAVLLGRATGLAMPALPD